MPENFDRYRGLGPEQCSREALRLVKAAAISGQTFALIGALTALEEQRCRGMDEPSPDWATQNTALRNARDAMDAAKKDEQQAEQQRQYREAARTVQRECLEALRTGLQQ